MSAKEIPVDDDDDDDEYVDLDPEAPGLDEATRARRRALAKMAQMSPQELFQIAVDAGIFTPDGELTAPYLNEEPSLYRPDDD